MDINRVIHNNMIKVIAIGDIEPRVPESETGHMRFISIPHAVLIKPPEYNRMLTKYIYICNSSDIKNNSDE